MTEAERTISEVASRLNAERDDLTAAVQRNAVALRAVDLARNLISGSIRTQDIHAAVAAFMAEAAGPLSALPHSVDRSATAYAAASRLAELAARAETLDDNGRAVMRGALLLAMEHPVSINLSLAQMLKPLLSMFPGYTYTAARQYIQQRCTSTPAACDPNWPVPHS